MTALTTLRVVAGIVILGVLIMWTVRRARGGREDPTVRKSKSTETGSFSFLISGSYAVSAAVVFGMLAFWPWIQGNLVLIGAFAALVVMHIWWEAQERD